MRVTCGVSMVLFGVGGVAVVVWPVLERRDDAEHGGEFVGGGLCGFFTGMQASCVVAAWTDGYDFPDEHAGRRMHGAVFDSDDVAHG